MNMNAVGIDVSKRKGSSPKVGDSSPFPGVSPTFIQELLCSWGMHKSFSVSWCFFDIPHVFYKSFSVLWCFHLLVIFSAITADFLLLSYWPYK